MWRDVLCCDVSLSPVVCHGVTRVSENVIFLRDSPNRRCEGLGMLSFCVTVPTDVVSDWQCYLSA